MIGSAHIRLGSDNTAFSKSNAIIFENIVDGGLFSLTNQTGKIFTLRRDEGEPVWGDKDFLINSIKIYETVSLLEKL